MITESDQIQMLLQKIRQYPVNIQQETLFLYLTYALRQDSVEDIRTFCENLLQQKNMDANTLGLALENQIHDEEKIKKRINKRLDKIITEIAGGLVHDADAQTTDVYQKLSQLEEFCEDLKSRVKKIAEQTKKSDSLSTLEMLNKIETDTSSHKEAMLHTAQTLFDRIFESVNPESAESYLDQSVLQVGPLKKAALYDASKDKYNQILEYHQTGHFIQDYNVIYKRYLRTLDR